MKYPRPTPPRTKRQRRNEKVNYSRIISAIEALVAKKTAQLATGELEGFTDVWWDTRADVRFWQRRIEALREKQLSE